MANTIEILSFSSLRNREVFHRVRSEGVEGDELKKLLHGQLRFAQEFLPSKEQIDGQGRVKLNQYAIFRVANKKLNILILFDFPEKSLISQRSL